MGETRSRRTWVLPAAAGAGAAAFGAGLGELTAAVIAPESGPFVVIGAALIGLAPPWAKDTAIALFGTGDKPALLIGIGVVLLVAAGAAGVLELRRPPWGQVVLGLFAVAGAVAAATRANAPMLAVAPSLVAGVTAVVALRVLVGRLRRLEAPVDARASTDVEDGDGDGDGDGAGATVVTASDGATRRGFLAWAGGAAAIGVLAAVAGSALRAGGRALSAVREAIRLPAAATTASVPAGAELGIDGLTPVITPNAEFYRIDTALAVPLVDPSEWRLRIHGLVEREVELTWDELLALPLDESITTLACVSNEVGGSLIGNAVWLGHPIRELLARARPLAEADMVLSRSVDGFTASTPLEVLQDDRAAILAVGMNGEPLPIEHGFPVRMVVPGLYGYVSATKWVVELEVTRFDAVNAYWTDRGWSARGPIKLSSRIDVPRGGQPVDAGAAVLAGVAWHQHVGVAAVEVQLDGGEWRPATLATAISDDTWVQWRYEWPDASPGTHTARVRAIGADGEVQTADEQGVVPDGATGLHEVAFDVS
ncbi:molybdopterin-dependent oxidoreductase [Agromyces sp. NPDC058064]|uniref:molybdopterin-dependent oxidoreductase n=1 Tax=Agromyces sp. NPDC058064 TaxID=3346322 RepID=UPI0036DBD912